MNFELKTLSLSQAAASPCDALVVLWPEESAAVPAGELAGLIRAEAKGPHWEAGVGKVWLSQSPAVCKAARLVLVRVGQGTPAQVRKAVAAAFAGLKSPAVKKVVLSLSALQPSAGALAAALGAAADATYAYTTTKSKPAPRALSQVLVGGHIRLNSTTNTQGLACHESGPLIRSHSER